MPSYRYITRQHYHLMWSCKYSLACVVCFGLSLWAWPSRAGLVALVVGYIFAGLSTRERRRAFKVLP